MVMPRRHIVQVFWSFNLVVRPIFDGSWRCHLGKQPIPFEHYSHCERSEAISS